MTATHLRVFGGSGAFDSFKEKGSDFWDILFGKSGPFEEVVSHLKPGIQFQRIISIPVTIFLPPFRIFVYGFSLASKAYPNGLPGSL